MVLLPAGTSTINSPTELIVYSVSFTSIFEVAEPVATIVSFPAFVALKLIFVPDSTLIALDNVKPLYVIVVALEFWLAVTEKKLSVFSPVV